MPNYRIRQILVVVLSITQLIANSLGGAGILFGNGVPVGDISDSFRTFFTPAGYTFAVWGPIYIGLTLYAIYQALPGQGQREVHQRVGWWAVSAAAANTLWTPVFTSAGLFGSETFQPAFVALSFVIIVWMLVSLAGAFVALRSMNDELTLTDRALVQVPYSGYFAWINIATVANVTTLLIAYGWEGTQTGAVWSAIAIAAAIVITTALILYSRGSAGTIAMLAVWVWAFIGVYVGNNEQSTLVGVMAIAAVVILVAATGFHFFTDRGDSQRTPVPA